LRSIEEILESRKKVA